VTGAVGPETAVVSPAPLRAVTATRIVAPASPEVTTYVPAVAPGIETQAPPAASQRSHWKRNSTGLPVHVPAPCAVSV